MELVLSWEPLLPAGVRMGERISDFGLESLEMGIATQRAVLFDKQIPSVPASKAVNSQGSQTPFSLECGHELAPRPPSAFLIPISARLQIPAFYMLPKRTASPGLLPRLLGFQRCLLAGSSVSRCLWLLGGLPGPSPKHHLKH